MALAAVQTAMNLEKQNVHPFFTKPHGAYDHTLVYARTYSSLGITTADPTLPTTEAPSENLHDDPDYEQSETGAPKGAKKRGRKPGAVKEKGVKGKSKSNQASLDLFARRSHIDNPECAPAIQHGVSGGPPLAQDLNAHRSKRRKTASPGPTLNGAPEVDNAQTMGALDWLQQLEAEAGNRDKPHPEVTLNSFVELRPADVDVPLPETETDIEPTQRPAKPPNDDVNASAPNLATETTAHAPSISRSTPKKTLKVNKNGKLISPRSTQPAVKAEVDQSPPKKKRGRKPKPKALPTIAIIRYGADAEGRQALGQKIESILNRTKTAPRPVTPKKAPPKPAGPPKVTHPFFLGKPALKTDQPVPENTISDAQLLSLRGQRKSAVTPGKLKAESRSQHSIMRASGPVFGSNRAPKQVGLDESAWPTRETAHVRNLESDILPLQYSPTRTLLLKSRKMKGKVPTIPKGEDIIAMLATQLVASIRAKCDPLISDFEPPKDVRLPTRQLTTGVNIQEQVRSQVSATLPTSTNPPSRSGGAHPAIQNLFYDIEHNLTPFDLATCEIQSWTHKYAPKNASHLLQAGKEAATLHDWLTNLTVMAVGGKADASKSASETKRPPKKKRKKDENDFIVDSDEEEEVDMIELEDGTGDKHSSMTSGQPTSFRRLRWTRNKNVVLISGPHGCGKSAMVYAVAKGLGFEVFEINPGSRRSGKDIQDKVGDMSENHLVNHKRSETASKQDVVTPEDTDSERHSTALLKDLESGRQGTMTSFFKGMDAVKSRSEAKGKPQGPPKAPTSTQATLPTAQAQPKSQKQSLILFEEADILFEEDQQFWAYVTRLAAQSKRPIIVTCNDEARIPIYELPLAAILRLSPPPINLATDYLLVLAGREGHVLERDAVSSLYKSKNHDLRASITELDLWCQMSLGDRKGGLEWMYQRWPPGKDVDENGQTLRIASQWTYQSGMGCISHNMFESSNNIAFDKEQELLKETWEDWGINPCSWIGPGKESEAGTLANLQRLDALSESTSAADIYCRIDLPSYERHHEQPTDPTLPPLPERERFNYTTAGPVIQVENISDFSQFDTDMFIQSHLCIQRAYSSHHINDTQDQHAIPTTEVGFTKAILQHKQDAQNKHRSTITRPDFSEALDLLAYPPDTIPATNTSYNLNVSSFDRTFKIIVEDLAPYVRSIVAHELALEAQRLRLGSLLSEGSSRNKRQRTTRAARTALEGGDRTTKRRERWFDQHLNRVLVMETAGNDWAGMGTDVGPGGEDTEGSEKTGDSAPATQEE